MYSDKDHLSVVLFTRLNGMTEANICPPETIPILERVVLHPVTYTDADSDLTIERNVVLYQNLAQFIVNTAFQYNPSMFSELFTKESLYRVPPIPASVIAPTVSRWGPHRHALHNEYSLHNLIFGYVFDALDLMVARTSLAASSLGDTMAESVPESRRWEIATEGLSKNEFVLRQPA